MSSLFDLPAPFIQLAAAAAANVAVVWRRLRARLLLGLLMLCGAGPLLADPPGRVGRIAAIDGPGWTYSPESAEWVQAELNLPLTSGDRVSAEPGARMELEIGSATVRLAGGTELEMLRIDDEAVELQLHQGSVALRLRQVMTPQEFSVVTGQGRFALQQAGRYRVDRDELADAATVLDGALQFTGDRTTLALLPGQRVEIRADPQGVHTRYGEPRLDEFADWVAREDRRQDDYATGRYVSPEMTGAAALDRYGQWEQSADYGPLWVPSGVPAGWAPYRHGRWAWVRPWGWTWVDEAPWGFAPFHYGRWVQRRGVWCWAPGSYVARPIYAPALVGWIGGSGARLSVSVGSAPSVGWFPLAPREVYVPGYRYSDRYWRHLNQAHVDRLPDLRRIRERYDRDAHDRDGDGRGRGGRDGDRDGHGWRDGNGRPGGPGGDRDWHGDRDGRPGDRDRGGSDRRPGGRDGDRDRDDYVNRRIPGAVTIVPSTVVAGRQPVAPIAARFERDDTRVRRDLLGTRVLPVAPIAAPPARERRPGEDRDRGASPPAGGPRWEGRAPRDRLPGGTPEAAATPTPRLPAPIGLPPSRQAERDDGGNRRSDWSHGRTGASPITAPRAGMADDDGRARTLPRSGDANGERRLARPDDFQRERSPGFDARAVRERAWLEGDGTRGAERSREDGRIGTPAPSMPRVERNGPGTMPRVDRAEPRTLPRVERVEPRPMPRVERAEPRSLPRAEPPRMPQPRVEMPRMPQQQRANDGPRGGVERRPAAPQSGWEHGRGGTSRGGGVGQRSDR